MSKNPLRDFAIAQPAFSGEVTFYITPFPTFEDDRVYLEFERLHPRFKWVHQETGEELFREPYPGDADDPVVKAQREQSEYERIDLWSPAHTYFLACVPNTVDIEFAKKLSNKAAQGVRIWWDNRNGSIEHNWALFRQTMGSEAVMQWIAAVQNAQDDSMNGPAALQTDPDKDTDPNA